MATKKNNSALIKLLESLKIKGEEVLLENTISNNKYTCKKAN